MKETMANWKCIMIKNGNMVKKFQANYRLYNSYFLYRKNLRYIKRWILSMFFNWEIFKWGMYDHKNYIILCGKKILNSLCTLVFILFYLYLRKAFYLYLTYKLKMLWATNKYFLTDIQEEVLQTSAPLPSHAPFLKMLWGYKGVFAIDVNVLQPGSVTSMCQSTTFIFPQLKQ